MNKWKLVSWSTGLLGWVLAIYLLNRHVPEHTPQIVEKTVMVDRVVTKNVERVKTKTLPNGIKVVEVTKTVTNATERGQTKQIRTTTSEIHVKLKYSLGVSVILDPLLPLKREYQVEISRRVFSSPFSGTLGYSTDNRFLLGLRYEF